MDLTGRLYNYTTQQGGNSIGYSTSATLDIHSLWTTLVNSIHYSTEGTPLNTPSVTLDFNSLWTSLGPRLYTYTTQKRRNSIEYSICNTGYPLIVDLAGIETLQLDALLILKQNSFKGMIYRLKYHDIELKYQERVSF